jgi:hypothetical protein
LNDVCFSQKSEKNYDDCIDVTKQYEKYQGEKMNNEEKERVLYKKKRET